MLSNQGRIPTTMRLPFAASSVPVARQRLKSFLGDTGGSEQLVEDARLVVSELVANAVRQARPLDDGSLQVSWALADHRLQVSVTDGGSPGRPLAGRASTSAQTGRGLAIVDGLADRWWSERTECRCTVHAVLPA